MILIIIDYLNKSNTDKLQRRLFCTILIFFITSAFFYFIGIFLINITGRFGVVSVYAADNAHFLFQALAFYYIFIFVDYIIYKESERTNKIIAAALIIIVINILILIMDFWASSNLNFASNRSFWIESRNYIKFTLCYLPMIFMFCNFFTSHKADKRAHKKTVLLFVSMSFLGLFFDAVFNTAKLTWPFLTMALLYAYFVIIRTDIQIDKITGIGNRYSFTEFINKLSQLKTNESYAIVIIDIDHFKEINEKLGHKEGDNALRDMAIIIKKCIFHSDFAARFGNDEFVLATKSINELEKLMNRIQGAINLHNEKHIRPFKLHISYGYDIFTTNTNQTIEEFLAHIDKLMFKSRENRRRTSDTAIGADL